MKTNESQLPQLKGLDHVAIRVADLETSASWYERVLGLKRYQLPEWGAFPIFMLAGTTGIALFPAHLSDPQLDRDSNHIKIDHFAFQVDSENFQTSQRHLDALGIPFTFQDHHYFHSIYFEDPDGHQLELTTLVVDSELFYGT